jgi:hypothetical protein
VNGAQLPVFGHREDELVYINENEASELLVLELAGKGTLAGRNASDNKGDSWLFN